MPTNTSIQQYSSRSTVFYSICRHLTTEYACSISMATISMELVHCTGRVRTGIPERWGTLEDKSRVDLVVSTRTAFDLPSKVEVLSLDFYRIFFPFLSLLLNSRRNACTVAHTIFKCKSPVLARWTRCTSMVLNRHL